MLKLAREVYPDFNMGHCLEMLAERDNLMTSYATFRHAWNGTDKWCLIAMIDDATSEIPSGKFFDSETTLGCMNVLRGVIEVKGVT